jgi:hypothetical protein
VPTWTVERGVTGRYADNRHAGDEDFAQAGTLVWDVLDDAERDPHGDRHRRSRLSRR